MQLFARIVNKLDWCTLWKMQMRNTPELQLVWRVAKKVSLKSRDWVEPGLAAEVAKPLTLVYGVLVPRPIIWVQTIFVFVSVPDQLLGTRVVMATLNALPWVVFYRIVELQLLVKLVILLNYAKDELGVSVVFEELYGLTLKLVMLRHS